MKLIFLGHVIDTNKIKADPEKTEANTKMSSPKSVPELRRLMGMINQLGIFSAGRESECSNQQSKMPSFE